MNEHKKLKVGIVGVGYFGAFHAVKAIEHPREELVGIFDTDAIRLSEVASKLNCKPYQSIEDLIHDVDAIFIATPASTHTVIASKVIQATKNVFIEKPIAASLEESKRLLDLVSNYQVVVHIGYLLRHSFEREMLLQYSKDPKRLFFKRTIKPSHRGNDVSVILDLMIHDLDYLTSFSNLGELESVVSSGDANQVKAKLSFANGCVAEFFVDRNAVTPNQEICSYSKDYYLSVKGQKAVLMGLESVSKENKEAQEFCWEKKDLLLKEHDLFVDACLNGKSVGTSIESAIYAQELAEQILSVQQS